LLSLHLVLLVSKRIVRLLSCFNMMLVVDLIVFVFHVHIVVMLLLLVTSSESLLLVHFLLGQLARHQVFSGFLLALVVLASLLLFEGLQTHPLFVAARLTLVSHLFFHFFSSIHFSHVCNFLGFIDLFLHEPVIHGLASSFVLFALALGHLQKFFLNLVLSLPN